MSDFASAVREIEEALEESNGSLVPRLVGPKEDTAMTTFTKERDAIKFVKAVNETGLNCWYREGNTSGYVAFINNRANVSASSLLSKVVSGS